MISVLFAIAESLAGCVDSAIDAYELKSGSKRSVRKMNPRRRQRFLIASGRFCLNGLGALLLGASLAPNRRQQALKATGLVCFAIDRAARTQLPFCREGLQNSRLRRANNASELLLSATYLLLAWSAAKKAA